jgi:hypothetical protein
MLACQDQRLTKLQNYFIRVTLSILWITCSCDVLNAYVGGASFIVPSYFVDIFGDVKFGKESRDVGDPRSRILVTQKNIDWVQSGTPQTGVQVIRWRKTSRGVPN